MARSETDTAAPLVPKRPSLNKVMRDRGSRVESDLAPHATVPVHPSSLLRIDDADDRKLARAEFERDLAGAWALLKRS